MIFIVRGPLPTQGLKPAQAIQRFSYRAHAKSLKENFSILAAGLRKAGDGCPLGPVHVTYVFCPPTSTWRKTFGRTCKGPWKPYCPRDPDNAIAVSKHALDGIREAGVIKDDNKNVVKSFSVIFDDPDACEPAGYLEIRLEERAA